MAEREKNNKNFEAKMTLSSSLYIHILASCSRCGYSEEKKKKHPTHCILLLDIIHFTWNNVNVHRAGLC